MGSLFPMKSRKNTQSVPGSKLPPRAVLGIEAGGTRTSVLMVGVDRDVLASLQTGPAVLPRMSDRELQGHFREIAARLPFSTSAVGIGMAGARREPDKDRLRRIVSRVWPAHPA